VDERRIRQVLINLLNNAIKFTALGGKITLSVQVSESDAAHPEAECCVCFSVQDTGIGIASEDLPQLFQPFTQIDSRLNRKYEGTGLGLVLVKQIVELHGGSVSVDSIVDRGSCFSFSLPQTLAILADSDISPLDLLTPKPPSEPLILLAEDNELNIETFSRYLTAKGYRLILAYNGQEAIDLAHIYQPDLILMDIQMPDMDGIAAIQYLRQESQLTHIPIIAITALATTYDRDKCLAIGANEYLAKPLKLKELHQTIQVCLERN
jgi:CheY-like chemotaxis protein